jgi:transposase
MTNASPFNLVIGLDRSDTKADLYLIDTHTQQETHETVDTAPELFLPWLQALRRRYPKARVAVCLEQPAGNLVAFLEPLEWIVLYPINPITLQKFREAFVLSRAKDDGKDAQYLARLLLTHHAELTPWQPEDPATRLIQQLVAHRRAVVDERTGLSNRLIALLKQYFPQALQLCGEELWRPLATNFLLRWPTLQALQKARPQTVQAFYYQNGSRSEALIQKRLELIAQAVPLTQNAALLDSYALRVQVVAHQLQWVQRAVQQYDRQIAQAFAQHPDRAIFRSLPGAGPVLAPRLLAAVGSCRERFPTAASLQRSSGIAPVTKQSGGTHHVHRRYLCSKFLRQSFHEYAKESILHSRWAAAYYWQQRDKECGHHTAVRALAFKWQRIIWRCWQDREMYQENIYEAALRRSGSPIVSRFKKIELGKSPVKKSKK